MKKTILSVLLMLATVAVFAQQQIMSFEVKGDEKSYNQVRVVNETSYTNFHCRVVLLNEDKSVKDVYGDYELKEKGDSDANTKSGNESRIKKGEWLGVQFPKNFTEEVSFFVEYKDYPLFDVIVIHLTDKGGGYEDEY
ncbi:MAG: hypothetical protein K5885_00940 [Bacteroidales bacterium]|nr:hypothetical protein [Bacteroidales bacterium]MBR3467653.1 hypothetical protein [Bacteroidales bacterium]MCR4872089.1 hypothetical protein [Bacteroidales bacterium]